MAKLNLPGRAFRVLARRERRKLDAEWKRLAVKERILEERSRILNDCEAGMHMWGQWEPSSATTAIPDKPGYAYHLQERKCRVCGLEERATYPVTRPGEGLTP